MTNITMSTLQQYMSSTSITLTVLRDTGKSIFSPKELKKLVKRLQYESWALEMFIELQTSMDKLNKGGPHKAAISNPR